MKRIKFLTNEQFFELGEEEVFIKKKGSMTNFSLISREKQAPPDMNTQHYPHHYPNSTHPVPMIQVVPPPPADHQNSVRDNPSRPTGSIRPLVKPDTTAQRHPVHYYNSPETFQSHTNLFISSPVEAQLLLEAGLAGKYPILNAGPTMTTTTHIKSGTVVIFAENNRYSQMIRWRDGKRWSPSRPQGPYLLYREVEAASKKTFVGSIHEESTRFTNLALRPNCRFIPNGLAKRTIGLVGSDGLKYRVISYFYPVDVEHFFHENGQGRLVSPSQCPEFQPFLPAVVAEGNNLPDLSSAIKQSRVDRLSSTPEALQPPTTHTIESSDQELRSGSSRRYISPRSAITPYDRQPQQSQMTKSSPRYEPGNRLYASRAEIPRIPPSQRERTESSPEFVFEKHCIFQIQTSVVCRCPCGGLGVRKAVDYFRGQEDWTRGPVILAPLVGGYCHGAGRSS
ncbi:hypothetical protein BDR26DRAFT_922367 [Obelidium mucronatum]|nr:hypothetical protein BDR26DRAFT_922367 [Obelidium mucronatum]